jgi:hypothetical protein
MREPTPSFDRAASAVAFAAVESIRSGALDNYLAQVKAACEMRMREPEYKAKILDRVSFRAGAAPEAAE